MSDDRLYSAGQSALDNRQWDEAVEYFGQVISRNGARVDGALYWKAYAQYKLGKTDDAVATLGELRKSFPQSKYLSDAKVLEADARKTSGKSLTGDADDQQIKLLAISAMPACLFWSSPTHKEAS